MRIFKNNVTSLDEINLNGILEVHDETGASTAIVRSIFIEGAGDQTTGFEVLKNKVLYIRSAQSGASSASLNVNGKGSKSIAFPNAESTGLTTALKADWVKAGQIYAVVYNGTYFVLQSVQPAIIDNLTSTSNAAALSAKQGGVLKAQIDNAKTTIVDNLNSTATTSALSARQGNVLKTQISNINDVASLHCIITFDLAGGTGNFGRLIIHKGEKISKPASPVHSSKNFLYWALSTNTTREYTWTASVNSNITLVAVWETIAQEFEYTLINGAEYRISKGTAVTEGVIYIPSFYNELPVTAIAGFSGCNITGVVFEPDSQLSMIGESAFSGCHNLRSFVMPEGVKEILMYAFSGCENLTNIALPEGLQVIWRQAFYRCINLRSIAIPSSLVRLGDNAFSQCTNLRTVTIPSTVQTIQSDAFSYCSNVTIYPEISGPQYRPNGWDDSAMYPRGGGGTTDWHYFGNNFSFTSLWGSYGIAAKPDVDYDGTIIIPSTLNGVPVTRIADHAFEDHYLRHVIIPPSITYIGDSAFTGTNIDNVVISDNVEYIGQDALNGAIIFTDANELKPDWYSYGNVIWGCGLSADKRYVVSADGTGEYPSRLHYEFSEWSNDISGNGEYLPDENRYYTIWYYAEE